MDKSHKQAQETRKRNEQARRERHRQEMEEVRAQAAALRQIRPRQGNVWRLSKCLKT